MSSLITRKFFRIIGFAAFFGAAFGIMGAKAAPSFDEPPTEDCLGCHSLIGDHWLDSAHGQASDNQAFIQAWEDQGNPPACMSCHATGYDTSTQTWETEGVDCGTCHTPFNENHPEKIMPTDVSSRLCGSCHLDTFAEWQESMHSSQDLTCNQCHNAHTTGLKTENSEALCESCHGDTVHSFELTAHAATGLLCVDCHLRVSDVAMGEGHGQRVHTFEVDLDTCTECHAEGMHSPGGEDLSENSKAVRQVPSPFPEEADLQPEPASVSPVGFTILGTLVGVGFGMILSPWLEKWYRRFRS